MRHLPRSDTTSNLRIAPRIIAPPLRSWLNHHAIGVGLIFRRNGVRVRSRDPELLVTFLMGVSAKSESGSAIFDFGTAIFQNGTDTLFAHQYTPNRRSFAHPRGGKGCVPTKSPQNPLIKRAQAWYISRCSSMVLGNLSGRQ